ncbi:MAG: (2Fe-2S)-binding protein [Desulfobacteraceae bacterium]|nr:(2Fe-2S)-binding protein [Desulfobacteraceae bacterium]
MKKQIRIKVNGRTTELSVPVERLLVDLLREDLKLTGTKVACGEGECGACTVLLNGKPVPSCLMLAAEADGCEITTIEGLSDGEKLDPLQEGFISEGAAQCGFCTPGMILTARAFLKEKPNPTEEEIRRALSGNLCRCTGYGAIVRAVQTAAGRE